MKSKKRKRRRVYSAIKRPIIVTKEPCENPVEILDAIYHFKNRVWTDFINLAVYEKERLNIPYEEDIREIIRHIKEGETRRTVIRALMDIKDYNPFTDNIPVDRLPNSIQCIIVPIQDSLKRKMEAAQALPGIRKFVRYQNKIYTVFITKRTKENLNRELYRLNNQILILEDGKNKKLLVLSDPDYRYRPDFTALYQDLEYQEPGIWHLYKHKGAVRTKDGKETSLQTTDIVRLLNSH